jgi:hypothetical protein
MAAERKKTQKEAAESLRTDFQSGHTNPSRMKKFQHDLVCSRVPVFLHIGLVERLWESRPAI